MNEEIGNRMGIKQRRNKNLDDRGDSREGHDKDESDDNVEEADSDHVLNSTSVELDYIDQSEKIEYSTDNINTYMSFSGSASTMGDDYIASERELSSSGIDNGYSDAENYYDVDYSGSNESGYSSNRYYDSSSEVTSSHDGEYVNFFYGNETASISETSDLEIVHSVSQRSITVGQGPRPVRNEEDRDLVIVESTNPEESYPRVTHEIIIMVLGKIYWAYYYVISLDETGRSLRPDQPNNFGIRSLSDILRSFSPAELGFLKAKIRRILISDFRNPNIVELLVEMVDPNKIDEGFQRTALKSIQYKDLINKGSKSCIICYESFKSTSMCVSLKCLHVFHSGWFNKSYSCPVCRTYNI